MVMNHGDEYETTRRRRRRRLFDDGIDTNISVASLPPFNNIRYVPMLPLVNTGLPYYLSVETNGYQPNLVPTLRSVAATMQRYVHRLSRNRVQITTRIGWTTIKKPAGFAYKLRLLFLPGRWSHFPIIGNAITSHHELFHEKPFSLGHGNTRIWDTQTVPLSGELQRDPFDPLTRKPGVASLNAAHLHYLQWFGPTEEAYIDLGIPYTLRVINDGSQDFTSLKAVTYVVPGSTRQVWFSYVKMNSNGKTGWATPQGLPGTALALHEAIKASTFLEGLFGLNAKTDIRSGLIVNITAASSKFATVIFTQDPNWIYESDDDNA